MKPVFPQDLASWLDHLEQLHSQEIDLGLERVHQVAQRLALPLRSEQRQAQVIMLAGTNGKGSTLTLTQALAQAAGCRTASYTSPHFLHFNERIQLDGQPVSDALIIDAFVQIEQARLAPTPISLSYFEFATLAALVIFSASDADLWLLEVGLGGRLDAVNLVDTDLAIITTVDLDHQAFLGETREAIGAEKAGILRPGRPVVLGSRVMPHSVLQQAEQLGCPVYQLGRQFEHQTAPDTLTWQWQSKQPQSCRWDALPISPLPLDNLASALQLAALSGWQLDQQQIAEVIRTTQLTGRMQRLGPWLLDVAHNPHAAHYLAQRLSQAQPVRRLALLGAMADKDLEGVLEPLLPWISAWVVTALPTPRACSAAELAAQVEQLGGQVLYLGEEASGEAVHRFLVAELESGRYDEVLVFGSFFTVAQQLHWLSGSTEQVSCATA
ncbi:folylpolyglutamate synthase/dihydrofolate synthase family protein [Marinospirillum sp. MEB164]|uniref:Dihydrofolate synthase/folylpolyglutamate synthase n=1 Tax=Marinospirillum alkalitolerans TaxID=3123374 RepID=A0ABW8PXN4_9GAMM